MDAGWTFYRAARTAQGFFGDACMLGEYENLKRSTKYSR